MSQKARDFNELMEHWGLSKMTPAGFGLLLYKYTDCGPSTEYILSDGNKVHYESDKARTMDGSEIKAVIVSSIVEGSNAEVGPVTLQFPFSVDDLSNTIDEINREADILWVNDNLGTDDMDNAPYWDDFVDQPHYFGR